MGLKEYARKRNFRVTPEPPPSTPRSKRGRAFVIQKHDATRLHYDLRLESAGVMKSWAVPKGPSLHAGERRLAVQTEDHPIEYNKFEGIIPEGEYGAGTVIVWDRGTYESDGDLEKALAKGKAVISLHGEKLHGEWHLVRTESRGGKDQWLLIKRKDEYARAPSEPDITEERPESVVTGRSLEEVAEGKPRRTPRSAKAVPSPKHTLPKEIGVQLATLADAAPSGEGWIHEIKLDGYRVQVRNSAKGIKLISRNQNDLTDRFSSLLEPLRRAIPPETVLDGELCVVDSEGRTRFQLLQSYFMDRAALQGKLVYFAFDLLFSQGEDLRQLPFNQRRARLEKLIKRSKDGPVLLSECFTEDGAKVLERACRLGLEGIISKRTNIPYRTSRTKEWLKVKCQTRQEFVIGGFTPSTNAGYPFGSLLVGHYEEGKLRFAGGVGTGFTQKLRKELYDLLEARTRATCPFSPDPRISKATWVTPQLVAEVEFTEWTRDGILRHPSFKGLRVDKNPQEVVREEVKVHVDRKSGTTKIRSPKSPEAEDHVTVAGVTLSNPHRPVFPNSEVTKQSLAQYYVDAAEWLLPHWKDRPLVLVRCPEGGKQCFYQKHARDGVPEEIPRVTIKEGDGPEQYLYARTERHIVMLVQLNVLEFHAWGSKVKTVERVDRLVFDLDPAPNVDWDETVHAARDLRKVLEVLGLDSWPKATGGKGIHVVVPVVGKATWDDVNEFGRSVARWMEQTEPQRFTTNTRKASRTGKIFLDYLRNARGATSILPFSARAREGTPVAYPLTWREIAKARDPLSPAALLKRLARLSKDPWEDLLTASQSLPRRSTWPN